MLARADICQATDSEQRRCELRAISQATDSEQRRCELRAISMATDSEQRRCELRAISMRQAWKVAAVPARIRNGMIQGEKNGMKR